VVWSTKTFLSEDEGLGAVLRSMFGYADSPHVIEVVTYLGYFAVAWLLFERASRGAPIVAPNAATSS
jgi:high-affinity Fe2+/Pb2+ permease